MHKKRQSPLLKSLKNPNAFKKKTSKLLKSLSPVSNFSHQSDKEIQQLTKTKIQIQRTRMISSEYALNYKQPLKHSTFNKNKQKQEKEDFKNAKILLNSALDVCSKGKSTSLGKMAEIKRISRNLSVSGSECIKQKQSEMTIQESGVPLFDSYRKKRYSFLGKSASSTNILQENIQQLELTKRKNEKLLINVLKKIKLKEDTLEEEREKFSMMKGIYLEQIKKLTKSLFGNKVKNYQLPISGTEKKLHKKVEVQVVEEYYSKSYSRSRKRIQTR